MNLHVYAAGVNSENNAYTQVYYYGVFSDILRSLQDLNSMTKVMCFCSFILYSLINFSEKTIPTL